MPKKSTKKTAKKAAPKKVVKKSIKKKAAKKSSRRDPVVLAFDEAEDFTISVVGQDGQPVSNRMAMEKMMGQFAKKLEMLAAEHGGSLDGFDGNELAAILNGMPTLQADSPADQAQEIVFEAFEARSSKKRIELANKALKIDPNCVDALILIAEETGKTRRSLIDQYRKAVAAGERSLGKKFIEENTGHFWAMHETRPYMRALEGLAANLRADGYMIESLETYKKMLILNPGDNQGVRYQALYLLIEADQDESAEELFASYSDDGSAWWNFGRALLDFRKSGDTLKTRKTLWEAIKENPFVPQYLLEIKERPSVPPGHYGIGDENEAMYYYDAAIRAWVHTPDVADWLLDVSKEFFEQENKKRKRR